ncbi:hypothetical protein CY34DRAFT_17681 [Suillus luteus UH-Slu-Lm8-n1]|uniref:Unplaced genomic scaffold CY34scaffold_613, whole genome shotgun sequence n=1 Tax=Suillus luteus UH-Slu-Lm8-n1 TaxID=930992 RepID=A0A0C9ZYK3_9AGAM|nr:hypothetical protein CY34DRAFT_17681 [Suillus luteus UH-Slu-Lm8-n1]
MLKMMKNMDEFALHSVLWHLTRFSLLLTAEHFYLRRSQLWFYLCLPQVGACTSIFLSPSVFVCYVTRPISVESLHFSILIIIIAPEPTMLLPITHSRSFTTSNLSLLHGTCLHLQLLPELQRPLLLLFPHYRGLI